MKTAPAKGTTPTQKIDVRLRDYDEIAQMVGCLARIATLAAEAVRLPHLAADPALAPLRAEVALLPCVDEDEDKAAGAGR